MAKDSTSKLAEFISAKPSNMAIVSSLFGMLRTMVSLPIQHPFDVIKVNWQANPKLKNELAVLRMIQREKGLKGLYSGYATNFSKHMFKSIYRYPLLSTLPRFYANLFGSTYEQNKHKMKLLTSFTLASVEAGLVTPFERLQVFIMTSKFSTSNYRDFYNMSKTKLRTEMFKGFTPYFTKQIVAWTTFLQADTFYKNQVRKLFDIKDNEMITGYKFALCTALISMTTIFCVMPFDNIKTFLQKYNLEVIDGRKTEKLKNKVNIPTAIRKIYARAGLFGFFTGFRVKLFVHFITSSFTVALLEYIENLHIRGSEKQRF